MKNYGKYLFLGYYCDSQRHLLPNFKNKFLSVQHSVYALCVLKHWINHWRSGSSNVGIRWQVQKSISYMAKRSAKLNIHVQGLGIHGFSARHPPEFV